VIAGINGGIAASAIWLVPVKLQWQMILYEWQMILYE